MSRSDPEQRGIAAFLESSRARYYCVGCDRPIAKAPAHESQCLRCGRFARVCASCWGELRAISFDALIKLHEERGHCTNPMPDVAQIGGTIKAPR